jgi:hypothetical protein
VERHQELLASRQSLILEIRHHCLSQLRPRQLAPLSLHALRLQLSPELLLTKLLSVVNCFNSYCCWHSCHCCSTHQASLLRLAVAHQLLLAQLQSLLLVQLSMLQ